MRWLEEFEMKHIEFIRSIRHFLSMHEVWTTLASESAHPGSAAFARRQSSLFMDLHCDAVKWYKKVSAPQFLELSEENMVQTLQDFRQQEIGWLQGYAAAATTE